MEVHAQNAEPWKVTLVDTGESTMTGGRLKRVAQYLDNEDFCFTYGDGVADINITELVKFHKNQNTLATCTATRTKEMRKSTKPTMTALDGTMRRGK